MYVLTQLLAELEIQLNPGLSLIVISASVLELQCVLGDVTGVHIENKNARISHYVGFV